MDRSELGYELPEHLIAQRPAKKRDDARLLVADDELAHRSVADLPNLLTPSLFVFNNTKVIPARLLGQKPTGGKVEILLVEPLAGDNTSRWLAMTKSSKSLREGACIAFKGGETALHATITKRREDGTAEVDLRYEGKLDSCLEAVGVPPLPPYISRETESKDLHRYQTVFASVPGAIAAPTAGLHFTPELLAALDDAGHERTEITLHVGPGTFAPLSQ